VIKFLYVNQQAYPLQDMFFQPYSLIIVLFNLSRVFRKVSRLRRFYLDNIFGIIHDHLKAGKSVVIASILDVQGSSPRHDGTKMLFTADGKFSGTIGGSLLEATVIQEAQQVFNQQKSKYMTFELTGENTTSKGMICGGRVEILLDLIHSDDKNIDFFAACFDEYTRGKEYFLVTHIKVKAPDVTILNRAIFYRDGEIREEINLSQEDLGRIKSGMTNNSHFSIINLKDTQVVIEPIHKLKTVYLFGAGHVAKPTAQIAALAGFRVVVTDDRCEYANVERFPAAADVRVIENFNQALCGLTIDSDSYIVILTRGHQYDREVLEQALKTSAGYIGMISSRKKRDAVYQALMEQGVTRPALERVHSPIGLAIKAETPEEIAVSIVGELIREKYKDK
jgi:xanthine dehydrogenase accessory factor